MLKIDIWHWRHSHHFIPHWILVQCWILCCFDWPIHCMCFPECDNCTFSELIRATAKVQFLSHAHTQALFKSVVWLWLKRCVHCEFYQNPTHLHWLSKQPGQISGQKPKLRILNSDVLDYNGETRWHCKSGLFSSISEEPWPRGLSSDPK